MFITTTVFDFSEKPLGRLRDLSEAEPHVSRCNVCMGSSMVQTVHSYSPDIPECPYGFEALWTG